MTTITLIFLFLAIIFWLLKINSHLKYFYENTKKDYPGFILAYIRSSLFEKVRAFIPVPVTEKNISLKLQKEILMYSLLFGVCFGVFFVLGYYLSLK